MRRFTNLVREGRFRSTAAADPLLRLGTLVEVDPADPTRIRQADETGVGGDNDVRLQLCGLLWYEHDSQTYNAPQWGGAAGLLRQDLDFAPNERMVQVLHGAGTKVWFRNTDAATTEPGLTFANTRAGVIMVDGLGSATPTLAVDDLLGWNNSDKWFELTVAPEEAFMRITHIDHDFARLDAELLV
jgi:hypothetical protein